MQRRQFLSGQLTAAISAAALVSALTPKRSSAQQSAVKPRVTRPGGGVLKVGLIELDTSHADSLGQAIKDIEGVELTAVTNRGLVYGKERTDKFTADYGVKKVCATPEEMAPLVDVAFSIGVNWDNHVADAEPFIKAGKPVFIDKPVVGSEAEARRLLDLAVKYRTAIFGGSTYRYAPNLAPFKAEFQKRRDRVTLTVYGKINSHSRTDMLDLIYYGIHGTELMQELMGLGVVSVSYLDFYRKQHVIHVHYDDRPPVILMLGWARNRNEAVLLTDRELVSFVPEEGNPYVEILSRMAAALETRRADRLITEPVEACRILIAAAKSRTLGRAVALAELTVDDGFDGEKFGLEYSRFRNLTNEEQQGWRDSEH
ncbi:MAG: Gfo/Idh/MocA family oxidoreductase [Candidatus Glassbacteria bacterium]